MACREERDVPASSGAAYQKIQIQPSKISDPMEFVDNFQR